MNRRIKELIFTLSLLLLSSFYSCAQYISNIIEYRPAPGQYINAASAGTPFSAQTVKDSITGMVNLGSFGGYIVFSFDEPVQNDPGNPYGVDFTIFGNPLTYWSEPGIVSVMKDDNGNGKADDTWYELAGSDYFFSTTIKDYEVTYTNPEQASAADVPWSDNQGNTGHIYANSYNTQPYYPQTDSFPEINSKGYTLAGTYIKDSIDTSDPMQTRSYPRAFGYADNRCRGAAPYTLPDNPYTRTIENSGGDAFDIGWAVDWEGNYVDLESIDFVKVHTAVLAHAGAPGELSTEITGAVDVPPDNSINGISDMIVIKELPPELNSREYQVEVFVYHMGRLQQDYEINWSANMAGATVDENNKLSVNSAGELNITATLASDSRVTASVSTLVTTAAVGINDMTAGRHIRIYPNPASSSIKISGLKEAEVSIYDITGHRLKHIKRYTENSSIPLADFPEGIYLFRISSDNNSVIKKVIKR